MKILCYADDPGGANGIIALAMKAPSDVHICADGAAVRYITEHGLQAQNSMPEKADALITGASHSAVSQSFQYIKHARENNIPSFGYVDAAINAQYRYKGETDDPLYYAPDFLFVTEEATRAAFIELGYQPERISSVGNPRYDFVTERAKSLTKNKRDKKQILFLADPLKPEIGENYAQSGFGASSPQDIRSYLLLDVVLDSNIGQDYEILIKLHPRNTPQEFEHYKDCCTIYEGRALGIDLAFQADLVIGTTTSLLVESALIGTQTIAALLVPQERLWLPHIIPDTLILTKDKEELKQSIPNLRKYGEERIYPSNGHDLCKEAGTAMLEIILDKTSRK